MTDQTECNTPNQGNRVAQTNQQTLHVHIHNLPREAELVGQIAGSAQRQDGTALSDCAVQLFFGPIGEHPVATTQTDPSGDFGFAGLPPGFYGLRLSLPGGCVIHLHNLRVLPGETSRPRLVLSGTTPTNRICSILEATGEDFTVRSLRIDDPT
ncbi:MAG: carboxypeptidase-like regulatory domain-containing protein [Bacillota bacterium]